MPSADRDLALAGSGGSAGAGISSGWRYNTLPKSGSNVEGNLEGQSDTAVQSGCCNGGRKTPRGDWAYVGQGKGSFTTDLQYDFVGKGAGSFKRAEVLTFDLRGQRWWSYMRLFGLIVGIAVALLVVVPFFRKPGPVPDSEGLGAPAKGHERNGSQAGQVSARYNCFMDNINWETQWSDSQKAYCCQNFNRGCAFPASASNREWDCDFGFSDWVERWSAEKKAYCCVRMERGCPGTAEDAHRQAEPTMPVEQSPVEVPEQHNVSKTMTQQKPVSSEEAASRSSVRVSTAEGMDCYKGFINWRAAWSDSKKAFCCQEVGRGCVSAFPLGLDPATNPLAPQD